MSAYKLGKFKAVIRVLDGATLPCLYDNGVVTPLDEHSPAVIEFFNWVALGGIPDPADPDPIPDPRLVEDEHERVACKGDNTIMALVNQTKAEWISWAGANFPSLTAAERTRLGTLFWVVAIGVRRQVRNGG